MKESLTKEEIVTRKGDIRKLFARGEKSSCRGASLRYLKNELGWGRIAVTFSRRYGRAVDRNYGRRVVKEVYRRERSQFSSAHDLLFVLYPGPYRYGERRKQMFSLVKRARFA